MSARRRSTSYASSLATGGPCWPASSPLGLYGGLGMARRGCLLLLRRRRGAYQRHNSARRPRRHPRSAPIAQHVVGPPVATSRNRWTNRPGSGNHRGSIFRLHVGEAILNRDVGHDAARGTWGAGSNAPAAVRAAESDQELAVSVVIGTMHVFWLPIDDPPSAASARGVVEAGAISLLSNLGSDIVDASSPTWLGRVREPSRDR
jgi:hypothetical protein